MKTAEEIESILAHCTSSDGYTRHSFGGLIYTSGVEQLADAAGAHWLIDAIASYQGNRRMRQACEGFQVWKLEITLKRDSEMQLRRGAVLTCQADSDEPVLIRQRIEYTDFPLPSMTLWVEGVNPPVLLLPSEH